MHEFIFTLDVIFHLFFGPANHFLNMLHCSTIATSNLGLFFQSILFEDVIIHLFSKMRYRHGQMLTLYVIKFLYNFFSQSFTPFALNLFSIFLSPYLILYGVMRWGFASIFFNELPSAYFGVRHPWRRECDCRWRRWYSFNQILAGVDIVPGGSNALCL